MLHYLTMFWSLYIWQAKWLWIRFKILNVSPFHWHIESERQFESERQLLSPAWEIPPSVSGGTESVFRGKVHWCLGLEDWSSHWFIFITNTLRVKVFCWWMNFWVRNVTLGRAMITSVCFQVVTLVGWAGGQELLHVQQWYFFLI